MVTFSDLMCLLLSFFVLLLSFSSVNQKDFNSAVTSIQGALGVPDLQDGRLSPNPAPPGGMTQPAEDAARKLRRRLQVMGLETQVEIAFESADGLKIKLPDSVLFDTGSADVKPDAFPLLRDVVTVLKEYSNIFVEVSGHTDTSPLNASSAYRDNYDLSYQRAHAVMSELAGPGRIPVEDFEITAAGAAQPAAPNITEEGRQANRRVEIHVRGLIDQNKADEIGENQTGTERPSPALPGESTTGPPEAYNNRV